MRASFKVFSEKTKLNLMKMAECQKEHEEELEPGQFCCSVCLELLKDPVTIPCGHSYCKVCIEGFWDKNEEKENSTCPQCRQIFNPRPALARNHMLTEVIETLNRKTTQQSAPSLSEAVAADAEACAGSEDIPCDFCTETERSKATKSCLTCMISYCSVHLEPHYSIPALKTHHLVSVTVPLQEKMCTKHNKLMEVYCKTDKKCICYLCVIDEHKKHCTASAAAEREELQEELDENQEEVQERRREREKELTDLLEALRDFKESSQTAVETNKKIWGELMLSLKQSCTSAEQLMLAQEKTAVAQAEELQLQLEQEIAKLKQRDTELEKISHVDDHIYFIQTFRSLSVSCESPEVPKGFVVRPKHTFRAVTDCMSKLKDDIEGLLMRTWPSITSKMSVVKVLKQPEPKTREEFLHYSCPLKLDESAVSKNMILSPDHLEATCKTQRKSCNSNGYLTSKTERITKTEQMWCCEALTDRCYWEVSLSGSTWCVAVSYKNKTSSYNSEFGQDDRSWSLECSRGGCSFRYNNHLLSVSDSCFSNIGVYLDYLESVLSFYCINGSTMTLLHKEDTTFTEPLYPCVGFKDDGSNKSTAYSAKLVKIWE